MSLCTRRILSLAVLFVMAGSCFAQIPNPGFETWANGDPTGWDTGNGLYTFVTKSTTARTGTAAAQGGVVNMGGFTISASLRTTDVNGVGFAITQRYAALHGYYRFTPVSGDFFFANFLAQKGTSGVGSASYLNSATQTVYTEFVANVLYPGSDVPDNGIITFSITGAGGLPHVGSTFLVEDLSFGPATGVNDLPNGLPKAFRLEQNYPNPFNPTTNIVYDVPEQSHVKLAVIDMLGREVAVVIDQVQPAGRYKAVFDASALSSGAYFYRLSAGSSVQTRKLVVMR